MPQETYACRVCPNKIKVESFAIEDKTVPMCHERPMVPQGFSTDFGGGQRGAGTMSSAPVSDMEIAAGKALLGPKPDWLAALLKDASDIE